MTHILTTCDSRDFYNPLTILYTVPQDKPSLSAASPESPLGTRHLKPRLLQSYPRKYKPATPQPSSSLPGHCMVTSHLWTLLVTQPPSRKHILSSSSLNDIHPQAVLVAALRCLLFRGPNKQTFPTSGEPKVMAMQRQILQQGRSPANQLASIGTGCDVT